MSDGLGIWLRRARETRQQTLEDAEKALRIRKRYLQALEMSDYTALPGAIQARGFLRNYARYLNLPAEEALARYDAEIQGRPMQPRPRPTMEPKSPMVDRPSVFSPPQTEEEEATAPGMRISSRVFQFLFLALVFFLVVAGGSIVWLQLENRTDPAESVATPNIVFTATPSVPQTQTVVPVFPVSTDGKVNVSVVANEHAWVSVSADANIIFQGIAETGQTIQATASEMLIVATGNGGAFTLTINGTDWGALGGQGEVVRRAWGPAGEANLDGQ